MNEIKCEGRIDGGASRVRGWHNYYDCRCKAKFKVTDSYGNVKYLCGRCKNKILNRSINPSKFKIELLKKGEKVL